MQTRLQFLSHRCVFASDCKAGTHKKKAFTLIELLVVIAVIGLLMAIIVPALKLAKQKGASVVCMANTKQLATCWYMYQDENDGKLVSPDSWVGAPYKADGTPCYIYSGKEDPVTDEDEWRGIRDGTLYPYIEAVDVFHCPGDNVRISKFDEGKIFRSYSIPAAFKSVNRFTRITTPGARYCMVEEAEGKNWNEGAWEFYTYNDEEAGSNQCPYWRDPIGIYHGNSGVLGFADGHAESRKWADSNTVDRVKYFLADKTVSGNGYNGGWNDVYQKSTVMGYDSSQVTDIEYMAAGWAHRIKPK